MPRPCPPHLASSAVLAACLLAVAASADAQEPAPMRVASDPAAMCCTVLELRQYTLHPFKRDVLIDTFEHDFVESQEALGIRIVGTFRDLGNPDRFVWLRGFADMPARAKALEAFYTGPAWRAQRERANGTMVDSDNVMLLRPAYDGAGFAPGDAPTAIRPGLVEARIYYFTAPPAAAQVRALAAAQNTALAAAGASPLATLTTEPAANNFPKLPVRTGEHALASFSQFPDRASYDRYLAALIATGSPWRSLVDTLPGLAARVPEVLLLAPTARSRLPR